MINIYTDGSCSNNPGKGGFGVVCISENKYINYVYREQCQETTNNREELKAIIKAIEFAKKNPEKDSIDYNTNIDLEFVTPAKKIDHQNKIKPISDRN